MLIVLAVLRIEGGGIVVRMSSDSLRASFIQSEHSSIMLIERAYRSWRISVPLRSRARRLVPVAPVRPSNLSLLDHRRSNRPASSSRLRRFEEVIPTTTLLMMVMLHSRRVHRSGRLDH